MYTAEDQSVGIGTAISVVRPTPTTTFCAEDDPCFCATHKCLVLPAETFATTQVPTFTPTLELRQVGNALEAVFVLIVMFTLLIVSLTARR